MRNPVIKYVPSDFIKLLLIGALFSFSLGLTFVLLDFLDFHSLRGQDAGLGGLILLALGGVSLFVVFQKNITLILFPEKIRVERGLFGRDNYFEFEYVQISVVKWNAISGAIAITLNNGKAIQIPPEISRVEGEIEDCKNDPEIPGGGSGREMFNLRSEILRRAVSAKR